MLVWSGGRTGKEQSPFQALDSSSSVRFQPLDQKRLKRQDLYDFALCNTVQRTVKKNATQM